MGDRRTAALVAGSAVKRRAWKTDHLNLDARGWLALWPCGKLKLTFEIPVYENRAP